MKFNWKPILFYVVLIGVIVYLCSTIIGTSVKEETVYKDIISYFENDEVVSFVIDSDNNMQLVTTEGKLVKYRIRDVSLFEERVGKYIYGEEIVTTDPNDPSKVVVQTRSPNANLESYDYKMPSSGYKWLSILPYVLPVLILVVFWFFMMRQATGGIGGRGNTFSKSRARQLDGNKPKVLFSDVAGADEEKEELKEVVEFLKNPQKFIDLGARIPRGILLVGPPGTGKTLLAKAVAGESDVPFYSISGSDFVELYVGVGASRVRDLFETAKKNVASIIFIDEIDAVGRHRGAGLGGGNDEREQTLNQLLVEMDGFGTNQGVIVMAATNRPDILDPALLRPGRFDRQITVNYPDARGRRDILRVHAKGKPFESSVDFDVIAKTTIGFNGADLANLLNEAALRAAHKNKRLIGMADIEEAMMKIIVGTPKKSAVILEKDRRITAYHEAGHAIVSKIVTPDKPVYQISVIPSGRALGYTVNMPKEDRSHQTENQMRSEIAMLLGGRAAERIIFKDVTSGASNDIQRATEIARKMVTQYGMSDLGPIVFGSDDDNLFIGRDFASTKNYSEKIAGRIDDAISDIISGALKKAEEIIGEHRDKLDFIAEYLVKNETLSAEQFEVIMSSDTVTVEEIEKMADDKLKQSDAENEKKKVEEEVANASSEQTAEDVPEDGEMEEREDV